MKIFALTVKYKKLGVYNDAVGVWRLHKQLYIGMAMFYVLHTYQLDNIALF